MASSLCTDKNRESVELSFLLQKTFNCPCCSTSFKNEVLKSGKNFHKEQELDLRPISKEIDPLKYGVIMCPNCGYAALNGSFGRVTAAQAKNVREKVTPSFLTTENEIGILDYNAAINRHKLALVNAVHCNAKTSEKAYLFLLIGWLLRAQLDIQKKNIYEMLQDDLGNLDDSYFVQLENEYISYLKRGCTGFKKAFAEENMPICGMDTNTVTYLIAALSYEIGEYQEAFQWVSKLITTGGVADRIKQRGRELRELIRIKLEN